MQKAIAYYRVSTGRQGRSGLGLEAQMEAVTRFAKANDLMLIDEFIDVNSGKRNDRPALKTALRKSRKENALLIIATLDRLSRSVAFISTLMESRADFKIVDNPYADQFTIHILAAVAQKTREDISRNTSAALAAAKMRGVQLGKYGKYYLSKLNKSNAEKFALKMRSIIETLKANGFKSARSIAEQLNKQQIPTFYRADHKWHSTTVRNLITRLSKILKQ